VQLYAGAFFPGLMLTALYIGYVVLIALLKPNLAPQLPESESRVELPTFAQRLSTKSSNAVVGLARALTAPRASGVKASTALGQLLVALLPALAIGGLLGSMYHTTTAPEEKFDTAGLTAMGFDPETLDAFKADAGGLQEPPGTGGASEPEGLQEPPGAQAPPAARPEAPAAATADANAADEPARRPVPTWLWISFAIGIVALALLYLFFNWARLEIFKMLLASFFPLALLILAVLGSIVFGLATPTEAAAIGALGGFVLAIAYRLIAILREEREKTGLAAAGPALARLLPDLGGILKNSAFLTAKTSAMVCWLFVGSSIFSAAFALLGGQELIEKWVLSLDMSPIQFMILAQVIIFLLGWPLEWTEIIVIFMPIFIPLLAHFNIDPLFFGLLVALNLQTAFLSPPVAMAAFYLKGVSPPHVTLNQIFAGMLPFMGIQVIAIILLYVFPGIGLWLPNYLYK
ncbi:MAG TPA: TRAP transporter large permease subunit, partial [Burkholderiales bacterium]|nr:TRAP transporter large permease subunit [Burkholderiales bacterium]